MNSAKMGMINGLNRSGKPDHPYNDWTHHGSKVFWPKDYLSHDIPNAKIQVYSSMRLLKTFKIDENVHNLGGLVVKQALLNDFEGRMYNSIYEAAFGLMLLIHINVPGLFDGHDRESLLERQCEQSSIEESVYK